MIGFYCGILVLLFLYSSGIEPGCESCGCCVNKECSREIANGHYINEYCTLGCIVGYGGNKCYNKCPDDCVTCEQNDHTMCLNCDAKKYLNEEKRCVDCPKNCKMCTSAKKCQECYPPYYNDDSRQDCSKSCPGNCLCETIGVCSSCQDGFYNIGNACQNACPITCKTCTDDKHCQSCKSSYSGDICCVKNGHCHKCSSSTVCEKCLDGYHGDQCGRTCPTKCKSSLCNRENGNCFSCQDGYYGDQCGKTCPTKCKSSLCKKENGNCFSCQDGYYGEKCGKSCPKTCHQLQCGINTGVCLSCDVGLVVREMYVSGSLWESAKYTHFT